RELPAVQHSRKVEAGAFGDDRGLADRHSGGRDDIFLASGGDLGAAHTADAYATPQQLQYGQRVSIETRRGTDHDGQFATGGGRVSSAQRRIDHPEEASRFLREVAGQTAQVIWGGDRSHNQDRRTVDPSLQPARSREVGLKILELM